MLSCTKHGTPIGHRGWVRSREGALECRLKVQQCFTAFPRGERRALIRSGKWAIWADAGIGSKVGSRDYLL